MGDTMSQVQAGQFLRAARRSRGLSVAKASELAGVSSSTFKRWEAGRGLPRLAELNTVVFRLGCPALDQIDLVSEDTNGKVSQRLLRAKRRRARMTLADLSALSGLSIATLHRYETGERAPNKAALRDLAIVYGCTLAEANLLIGEGSSFDGSLAENFLEPDRTPHFWLYRALEEAVSRGPELTGQIVLEIVQSFTMMGDHRGLLEAWELLRPRLKGPELTAAERATIGLSLALARFTVTGNRTQARDRVERWSNSSELPPDALSHLSRIFGALGDLEGSERWLRLHADHANQTGDEPQIFVTEVNRILLEFARTRSPQCLRSLEALRSSCTGSLQRYTLDVAELYVLERLCELEAARLVMDRCRVGEATFGVGSPLALRIGMRLRDG